MFCFRSICPVVLIFALAAPLFSAAAGLGIDDFVGRWLSESPRVLIGVAANGALTFTPLGEPAVEETKAQLKDMTNGVATWQLTDSTIRGKFEAGWLEFGRVQKDGGKVEKLSCLRLKADSEKPVLAEAEKIRAAVRARKEEQRAAVAALMAQPETPVASASSAPEPAAALDVPDDPPDTFDLSGVTKAPSSKRQGKPVLPPAMRRSGLTGVVVVELIVGKDGGVMSVRVLSSTHADFEKPAIDAVSQWKYSPGLVGTRPVNTKMTESVVVR